MKDALAAFLRALADLEEATHPHCHCSCTPPPCPPCVPQATELKFTIGPISDK